VLMKLVQRDSKYLSIKDPIGTQQIEVIDASIKQVAAIVDACVKQVTAAASSS
jgi:monomeric isocitrate dehydrogenase